MTPKPESTLELTIDTPELREWRGTVQRGDLVIMREFSHHVEDRTLSVESKYRLAVDTVDIVAFTVDSEDGINLPVEEFCQEFHMGNVDAEADHVAESFGQDR